MYGSYSANESCGGIVGDVDIIQGYDFANWLKNTIIKKDFVVMKIDVERTKFDLILKLINTGVICLIGQVFVT